MSSCIFLIISAIFIWKRGSAKSLDSALYENEASAFSPNQNAGLQKSFILPLLDLHCWFCTVILHYTTPWFAPANQDNSTIQKWIYILQLEREWLEQITTLTQCKIIFIYTCCSCQNPSIICFFYLQITMWFGGGAGDYCLIICFTVVIVQWNCHKWRS